jgi:tetrapyrrole methylase family protein / MazG family protein
MPQHHPHVTVVGLGPAGPDLVGDNVAIVLAAAPGRAYLRTARHPAAVRFAGTPAFDHLYESEATFEEVYAGIVEMLVTAAIDAGPDGVVYAVPGSPMVAERTVDLLRADGRVEITVLPALSFLDLAWAALGVDPLAAGVRLVDAGDAGSVLGDQGGPFLVAQCWSRHLLSEVKLAVPDEEGRKLPRPVLLHHLGLEDEVVVAVDWWDLDRTVEPDHLTSVYIPAVEAVGTRSAAGQMAELVALMDTLRERCPWDAAQTHASLMPHLVEESYEVLDALAELTGGDEGGHGGEGAVSEEDAYAHLREELGDLLFQIVFHARLASEAGQFDLADVARGVHDKLMHRHPHVFGDVEADTAAQVVTNWEAIKKTEKNRSSVTEGIPASLPALMLTTKLARKARGVGVDPDRVADEHAAATLAALLRRAAVADPEADDPLAGVGGDVQAAVGELLYAVATLAQRLGIDAEQALRDRALVLRAEIRAAEGVPEDRVGNR